MARVGALNLDVTPGGKGEITRGFDVVGQLLGLEVLNARGVIPAEVLAGSEQIGKL